MEWYNSLKQVTIKEIIEFHYRFESIHPFQDGNGRIGRIIMFKECLKNNLMPFIVLDKDKPFYMRGLKEYKNDKMFLIDTIKNEQDIFKTPLKKKEINTERLSCIKFIVDLNSFSEILYMSFSK